MRCVVLGMRNAVRCEIWCYGDMVIWPGLQARAFALASGGFAISISGTRNEIMELRVLKICIYCTIDFPGICKNNPPFSLLAILASSLAYRVRDMRFET